MSELSALRDAAPPRPFVHRHKDKRSPGYSPSLFEATGEWGECMSEEQMALDRRHVGGPGALQAPEALKIFEIAYLSRGPIVDVSRLEGVSAEIIARAVRSSGSGVPVVSSQRTAEATAAAAARLDRAGLSDLVDLRSGDPADVISSIVDEAHFVLLAGAYSYRAIARQVLALRERLARGGVVQVQNYSHPANDDPQDRTMGVRDAIGDLAPGSGLEIRGRFGQAALFEQR